jgi:uncharacterized repeat protein (TIGR01451 family)
MRSLAVGSFFLLVALAQAQLVFITQPSMRDWYNNRAPGSVDANGYLNTADPGLADITQTDLNVNGTITIIEGLGYLPNLTLLSMYSNGPCAPYSIDGWPPNLTTLGLDECGAQLLPSWPPALQHLIANYSFAAFPLPLPAGLLVLEMYDNDAMLSFPQLPDGLQTLELEHVNLVTDLGPLPASLQVLDVVYCQNLSTLAPLPSSLETLHLWSLPALAAVPPCPSGVEDLVLGYGLWDSMTEWPDSLTTLYLGQDWSAEAQAGLPYPGLCIPPLPDQLGYFNVYISPGSYGLPICLPNYPPSLVAADYAFFLEACLIPQVPIYACGAPDPECLSTTTLVKGVAFNDENGDGLMNGGESPMPGAGISIEPGGLLTSSDQSGVFTALPGVGSFTVTGVPATYWTVTTAPQTTDLLTTGATDSVDAIGSMAIPGMYDLRVDISCTGSMPGNESHCWCSVKNVGTEPQTAVLSATMDADQSVIGVNPAPLTQSGNDLTWTVPVLQPGETWAATVDLATGITVPQNTDLQYTATVDAEFPDLSVANNTSTFHSAVVVSVDPNDKMVWPNTLSPAEVSAGARVEYTVRFQNTGTASAERVVINDTLSTDLQWASMELIASSHPQTWTIQNGVLYIVFDHIQLPDSNSNEPDSHGFVKFSMRPGTDLMPGESVGNTANIYFDFNEPVITNEAVLQVDASTSTSGIATEEFLLWPNPVGDMLMLAGGAIGSTVEIVDVTGRSVVRSRVAMDRTVIDMRDLTSGMYILRLLNGSTITTRSFVKR